MSTAGRNTVTGGAGATGAMVSDIYGDARSLWRHGQEGTMGDYFKDKLRGK